MDYYDIASINVPSWFGFKKTIKPVIIQPRSQQELFDKTKTKGLIVLKNPSSEIFRKAIDKSLVDVVLPDRLRGHDYLHNRKTILSNVTAKIMKKYNISLMFTFKELKNSGGLDRALVWGRMKYDLWICQKKGLPIIIASGAENKKELVSARTLLALGELLGLRPEKAKQTLSYVQEKILERTK